MQVDFHYYCVFVLAFHAGFNREEARTVAYSSQYVDDATESRPINLERYPFDPVRTAYYSLKAYNWDVQKKIYIPFHFLPPEPLRNTQCFTYVTQPNSNFAQILLREASKKKKEKWLHRLGIALHTYADTWAHQGFSGRQNKENDVEEINLYGREKWKKLLWENILFDALPMIGHCEANRFPDLPFLTWKYENYRGEWIERNNSEIFLLAAKTVFRHLCRVTGQRRSRWQPLETPIKELLQCDRDINERCKAWKERFPEIFVTQEDLYDSVAWRKEALRTESDGNYYWDNLSPDEFEKLNLKVKEDFFSSNWVSFQRAAFQQRNFVLYNLT